MWIAAVLRRVNDDEEAQAGRCTEIGCLTSSFTPVAAASCVQVLTKGLRVKKAYYYNV
jgi:hypothetical protein